LASGTDALSIMRSLRALARRLEYTMVVTLQAPGELILEALTDAIVMSQSKVAYAGPGGAAALVAYFAAAGCPGVVGIRLENMIADALLVCFLGAVWSA
jgi:hypothetical protein